MMEERAAPKTVSKIVVASQKRRRRFGLADDEPLKEFEALGWSLGTHPDTVAQAFSGHGLAAVSTAASLQP